MISSFVVILVRVLLLLACPLLSLLGWLLFFLLQIEWRNRNMDLPVQGGGWNVRISVNGVDFRISEPKPFDSKWYSHKFKGPGVRYEVGMCIRTGWIVWVNGPFPCGSWPDLKIAQEWLFKKLEDGEKVIADGGYPTGGMHTILPRHLDDDQRRVHSVIQARHKIVNRRLKQWHALGGGHFWSKLEKHGRIFACVATIMQIILREESQPFTIDEVF